MKKSPFTQLALRCASPSSSLSVKGYLPFLSIFFLAVSCGDNEATDQSTSGSYGAFDYAPEASHDSYTIDEDAPTMLLDVLANDSDQNGNALTVLSIDASIEDGTASIEGDAVSFTADADFNGIIAFAYVVEDSTGMTDIGIVTVNVLSINDAPRSNGIVDTIFEETGPITYDIIIDAEAFDVEGDDFWLHSVTPPDNGVVVYTGGQGETQFTYQPDLNFWGVETFTFRLDDGLDVSDHTVTINVTDIDDELVVNSGFASTNEDVPVAIDLAQYAVHFDSTLLSLVPGTLAMTGDGTVVELGGTVVWYEPKEDFNNSEDPAQDEFTFTLTDGFASKSGTVTMTVNAVNDAPESGPVHVTTPENDTYTIDVLSVVSDIDEGDTFTVSLSSEATLHGGTVTVASNELSYTPALWSNNFITGGADDVIDYIVTDSGGANIALQATVTVTPVNTPITAADGFSSTDEDLTTFIDLRLLVTNHDLDDLILVGFPTVGDAGGTVVALDPVNEPLIVQYTPTLNFNGTEVFNFTVEDGVVVPDGALVTSASGTVTMTIDPENDALTGDAEVTITVIEDSLLANNLFDLAVLANVVDIDGDTLVYTFPANSDGGVDILPGDIQQQGTGPNFQYAPFLNYNSHLNGNDSFVVVVDDQNGEEISITVNIIVTPVGDEWEVQHLQVSQDEDTTADYNLEEAITNFSNVDEDVITIFSFDTATINGATIARTSPDSNILRYTPAADWNSVDHIDGFDTVVFVLEGEDPTDGTSQFHTRELRVNVLDVNDVPVAGNGSEEADEDLPATWDIVDSYVSDVDPASTTAFTITSAVAASGATVTIDPSGESITYLSPLHYNSFQDGDDVVTYTVIDNSGDPNSFDSGDIIVVVNETDDGPTIVGNFPTTAVEDLPELFDVFLLSGVQDEDDPNFDNSSLTLSLIDNGRGDATFEVSGVAGNGIGTYTSNTDGPFDDTTGLPVGSGTETIIVRITDDSGLFVDVSIHVQHRAVNDAPREGDFESSVDEDETLIIDLVLDSGAVDVELDTISMLTFDSASAEGGTIVLLSGNSVAYTPLLNFEGPGTDTFTFVLTDDGGLVDPTDPPPNAMFTVDITVNPVNDAPTAISGTADVDEDNSVSTDVVALGSDVDLNDTLILLSVTPGNNGVVTVNGDLAVYTPNPDFNGTDTYTFTLEDSGGLTVTESVNVLVNAINDAPRGNSFSSSVEEDVPLPLDLVIGSGAIDIEFDSISVLEFDTASEQGGVIVANGTTGVIYTPAADFEGEDRFDFTLTDSQPENSESDSFTVTIEVIAVPDAPVANDDSFDDPIEALNFWRYSGPMDITDDVLANDTDADDGDVLVVDEIDVTSTTGDVILDADVLTYEPAEGASDIIDTFDYHVSDGGLESVEPATVTVDIAPNNSVKYMGQVGVLQSTRSLSKADVDGYAVIVDVPGEYASVMRISDVDPSNLGNIVWEVSLETPANPTVALLVDAEVASNSSNEAVVAAIYSFHPDAVLVTGINSDGSLGFSVVLAQASGLSATIGIEGLALDGLGGCIVGLRLDDGTLRITHLDADGLILDSQVVDPSFGTINSISNIAGDYYLAMSTGILKLDSSLLGVYHFGNTGSPININSVRPHAIAGIVVAGSNGYLALIDDITVPATPTVFWAKDISGATLETVEFNDLVSNTDGNVYVVGETSDNRPTFYSVAGGSGAQNFVMRTYSSPWDSAEFNTLTQSDVALDQSLVGSMSVGTDSNFFRFEASNIDGFPVITCSPDGHGIANSGFLTSPSVLVMSVTAIVDVVDTDISGDPGPVTSETTSLFRRRANL